MKSRQTHGFAIAAAKAGFSTATAYRIEADPRFPSHKHQSRGRRPPIRSLACGRARSCQCLKRVRAVAIFEGMGRRYPDLAAGVRRTLERRVARWRALNGPAGT
jgi:hypothetical protein